MDKLDGKIAHTGGSDVIGFATAQQFLIADAAHVFIIGQRQDAYNEAVKKLGSKKITTIQNDVLNLTDQDKLYDVMKKKQSGLDIVFANAEIHTAVSLESISKNHYDNLFNTNVTEVLFTVQKALAIFSDGGSIILDASTVTVKEFPNFSVYNATKQSPAPVQFFVPESGLRIFYHTRARTGPG